MKTRFMKIGLIAIVMQFCLNVSAQQIVRGPYLNSVTPSSVSIRWRTDVSCDSKVSFGTSFNSLDKDVKDLKSGIDHEIVITGLTSDTKFYYTIGSTGKTISKPDPDQYFKTVPAFGSATPVRIWALGDFGNSSKNQIAVRDAIIKATANHRPDAWIWLGDNAYSNGKETEYQKHVFNIYQDSFFKNITLYPSPGNHDYGEGHKTNIPYFSIFTMPQHGEAGGVPSGSEAYYSVDYSNVHLVSLDSYGELDGGQRLYDTLGKQVEWLKKDLSVNKLKWTVLYWHHPPYTKGSHDSDTEEQLVKIRENLVPILERYNVDLVICGHSHVYERTLPIRGHYGLADTFNPTKHVVATSDSPNAYYVAENKKQGIIYIVNGAGGQVGGEEKGYPLKAATFYNNTVGGSMILDFSGNRLDAKWICSDGVVRDQFSIVKD